MALFRAILALGKPTAVFVMSAGGVDVSEIKATGVPIIAAGYGGESGGQATTDVLTGAYNPGGALTLTYYTEQYAASVSYRDMGMRPSAANGWAGRTWVPPPPPAPPPSIPLLSSCFQRAWW
jgi:beta-glucosidase